MVPSSLNLSFVGTSFILLFTFVHYNFLIVANTGRNKLGNRETETTIESRKHEVVEHRKMTTRKTYANSALSAKETKSDISEKDVAAEETDGGGGGGGEGGGA